MQWAGIVAEYNPFHTGHAYQIQQTRRALGGEAGIAAVMSGNWVQSADCAIADKWTRARLALMGGADLVLELPTVWAMSSAESFARGAVELLAAAGAVDVLSFGSECGDAERLEQVAACLDSPACQQALRRLVDGGAPFAACRQAAVGEVLGEELAGLLARPNNNLGVEYIRALRALKSGIRPMTVLRRGAPHNGVVFRHGAQSAPSDPAFMAMPQFMSATQIRMDLMAGDWDQAEPYLLPGSRVLLERNMTGRPGLRRVERAVLARVRTMTAEDWARLPDSGAAEGLPRRLERCDAVLFLDYPRRLCLFRALRRILRWRGRTRPDMAEGCPERLDPAFIRWIWDFHRTQRPRVLELLDGWKGEAHIFRSPAQCAAFLAQQKNQNTPGME